MQTYGEVFRHLRKNKGFTLKELSEEGLSISLIAQFEKNQSKLSFDRFDILLNKIGVDYNEFMQLVYGQRHATLEEEMIANCYTVMAQDRGQFKNENFFHKKLRKDLMNQEKNSRII